MERMELKPVVSAAILSAAKDGEKAAVKGRYVARCYDVNGVLKWEDYYDNLVTDVGAQAMLDAYLAGSSYTGSFYMGLISGTSYTGVADADTMTSHAGWMEAASTNAPAYSGGTRPYLAWSAATGSGAGSRTKQTSSAASFTFSSAGVVKGSFLCTNAVKDGTTGTLFSAGLFSGGDKNVAINDSLQVSYQLSL